jgi:hypothetical protein
MPKYQISSHDSKVVCTCSPQPTPTRSDLMIRALGMDRTMSLPVCDWHLIAGRWKELHHSHCKDMRRPNTTPVIFSKIRGRTGMVSAVYQDSPHEGESPVASAGSEEHVAFKANGPCKY